MKDYSKLQNGSDIRGIAIEGIKGESPNLTATEAADIAVGYAQWLGPKTGKIAAALNIAVGRDPRISGEGYGFGSGFRYHIRYGRR